MRRVIGVRWITRSRDPYFKRVAAAGIERVSAYSDDVEHVVCRPGELSRYLSEDCDLLVLGGHTNYESSGITLLGHDLAALAATTRIRASLVFLHSCFGTDEEFRAAFFPLLLDPDAVVLGCDGEARYGHEEYPPVLAAHLARRAAQGGPVGVTLATAALADAVTEIRIPHPGGHWSCWQLLERP